MSRIERLEAVIAYSEPDNPWLTVFFDRVRFPDGREGRYNRCVVASGRVGVVLLPLKRGQIGLVRQFRYPVGFDMWELPRGFGETDSPEDDARRELLEEMGETADRLVDLGMLYADPGMIETGARLFFAECADEAVPDLSARHDGEITETRWVSPDDLMAEVRAGRIADGFTLSILMRAVAAGVLPLPRTP